MWHLLWKAQSRFWANVATCIWTKDTGNKIFDIKLNHNKVRNDDVLDLCWRKFLNLWVLNFSVSEAAVLPVKSWIYNVESEVLGPIFKDRFRFIRRLPMVTYCRSLVQSVACWQSYMACFARHYWTFYYDSGYQKWHFHSVWIRPMILVMMCSIKTEFHILFSTVTMNIKTGIQHINRQIRLFARNSYPVQCMAKYIQLKIWKCVEELFKAKQSINVYLIKKGK